MPSRLEVPVTIGGADGLLADQQSSVAVVVTHPWGPLGGNMHNNVVSAAVLYFQQLGLTTLRFNFSGCQIGRGGRQVQQVQEAARLLLSFSTEGPCRYILLVGYSYGSLIAASASFDIPQCVGCVSIAPPWSVQHWLLLFNSSYHMNRARQLDQLPRLMVMGSRDNFTNLDVFREIVSTFPSENTTGAGLKGADHFFRRRERDLMGIIGKWLLATYPQCEGDLRRLAQMEFSIDFGKIGDELASRRLDEDIANSTSNGNCAGFL